ncbi:unnamed protein product [Ectocarpus sp. 12 AP-2014]
MRVKRCKVHHGPAPCPLLMFRVHVLAKLIVRLLFNLPCFNSNSMIFPIPLVGQTFPYLTQLSLFGSLGGKTCLKLGSRIQDVTSDDSLVRVVVCSRRSASLTTTKYPLERT